MISDLRIEKLLRKVSDFWIEADFQVPVGARLALVGPSGSGKTTLLRIIAGFGAGLEVNLETSSGDSDSGKIYLGDYDISRLPPQKRDIGFVFQDQALFSSLDVCDNITFGLRMRGASKEEREALARTWLEKVGMTSKLFSPVEKLSGGEKQRIALIRALIWKPKLLLLDEPFSAMDHSLKENLRRELIELHRLWPVPLLLVTHDESDVQALATSVLQMRWDEKTRVSRVVRS